MAQNLDDCEFWLPPKFLADDDTPFLNINNNKNGNKLFSSTSNDDVFNAVSNTLFPYYFTSPLTSSETESDEEEQIDELTRQMTHSTLQHHKVALNNHHHKVTTKNYNKFKNNDNLILFVIFFFIFEFYRLFLSMVLHHNRREVPLRIETMDKVQIQTTPS